MVNKKLAAAVRTQILEHPETHNQMVIMKRPWDMLGQPPACGTQACVAGWAYLLGAEDPRPQWDEGEQYLTADFILGPHDLPDIWDTARDMLELTVEESDRLFDPFCTREQVLDALGRMADGERPFADLRGPLKGW